MPSTLKKQSHYIKAAIEDNYDDFRKQQHQSIGCIGWPFNLAIKAVIEEDYDDFLQQQQQSIEQQQQNINVEAPATANQNQT